MTRKLIDELSVYYRLVTRRNTDSVENMNRFPVGEDYWCSWQKTKASHTLEIYIHKPAMPMKVFDGVQKIYEDLTRGNLLSHCLGGFTQNANESLNSIVWSITPKAISSGKSVVDIATNIAVITYNDGFRGLLGDMSTFMLGRAVIWNWDSRVM